MVRRYSAYAGRQPAPRAVDLRRLVPADAREASRRAGRALPRGRRAGHGRPDLHPLPALRRAPRQREQAEREQVARYHRLGYQITTYFNPHVCTELPAGLRRGGAATGCSSRTRPAQPYLLSNPFTADEQVSEIDFTHPDGRALFGRLLDEAIADGYDGWMEDFGEYTPTDSVLRERRRRAADAQPLPGDLPLRLDRRTRRDAAATAVFIRSGFHGVQPLRARRLGRRPDRGLELHRRPLRGGAPGALDRACRGSPTRAPTSAASTRS